ncbi:MAG: cobalamin-binding protein [Elusimicrobia bacterium]|nr:cobalamin-binding protein [Elusimicrobiota bacterium]
MMNTSSITLITFLSFLLCSTAAARTSESHPQRIISLAPSITKSLYLLGLEKEVVAVTVYCPIRAKEKEKIGTVLEPNIEKIVSLNPGLIIASKEGNLPQPIEKLRKLGLKVYVMDQADSFNGICKEFVKLGKITGREEKSFKIVSESRKRIESLSAKIKAVKHPSIFWQISSKPIFTASSRSFINDFIEFAGGRNVFADLKQRHPQVSREEIITRNPDIMIITAMGAESAEVVKSWQKFPELNAVRNGNIFVVEDDLFSEPTPVAIAQGSEMIFNLIDSAKSLKKGVSKKH